MDAPLLRTKLYMPPVRPRLVGRVRLVERLNRGLYLPDGVGFARKLTLISAPAGFGKTTLLAEWLSEFDAPAATRLAWLSLDLDDNAPVRFLTYLIAAVQDACPDLDVEAGALMSGPQPPSFKTVLTLLINALTEAAVPLLLVLDDYHLVDRPAIHDALTFLLDHLPPSMHLVVASRADPPLPLPRLRTRGALLELRAADLRFTIEEAAAFLNDAMGLALSPQDVAALEVRTEGWISGLQLAALALQSTPGTLLERAQFIAAFGGSHQHVIDYLAEEVLARQPADVRAFLLQTSILDRLSAPLCAAVTGRNDSDAVLHHLEHANLFLERLDAVGEWYRYHRLFADFLHSRLQQEMPERVHDLHCWAAEWYEQHDHLALAIGHALQANEFEWAARLLEQVAQSMLLRGEALTWLGWVERLPARVRHERLWLCVYWAWGLIVSGQLSEAETCLAGLAARLETVESPGERTDLEQQMAAIQAMLAMYHGDIGESARLARETLQALTSRNEFLRSILTWLMGLTIHFPQDISLAEGLFSEMLEINQSEGNTMLVLLSLFVGGSLLMLQGRLSAALALWERGEQFERASEQVGRASVQAPPEADASFGFSLIYQGMADVARERNELALAERRIARCVELGERWGNAEVLADDYVVQVRIELSLGRPDRAEQAIRRGEALARAGKLAAITARMIEVYRVRVWLAQGDLAQAGRWAETWLPQTDLLKKGGLITLLTRAAECSSLVRVALARRRFGEAEGMLDATIAELHQAGWHGSEIELLALRALVLDGQDRRAEALDALAQALTYAQPEGYARVFIDLGASMERLLAAFARQDTISDEIRVYLNRLLAAFRGPGASPIQLPQPTTLFEPLSDRELEVLRLIADGLTNNEIAERLTVAVSTVKTHVNNLYRKLDVSKRTQAVACARELNLL